MMPDTGSAQRGSTCLTHTHLAEAARARDRRVGEILAQYAATSQGGIAKVVHLGTHRGGADVERMWTELLPAEIPELAAVNLELISVKSEICKQGLPAFCRALERRRAGRRAHHDPSDHANGDAPAAENAAKFLEEWSRYTAMMDPAGLLVPHLRHQYRAEGCSHAWAKMWQFLSAYPDLLPLGSRAWRTRAAGGSCTLRSFHLCEAPGGFIFAMNHFLKTRYPDVSWRWHANTLCRARVFEQPDNNEGGTGGECGEEENPDAEGAGLEKDPIARGLSAETFPLLFQHEERWCFGRDGTGNILVQDNVMAIVDGVLREGGGVDLVTADGSIDCSADPAHQEAAVAPLLFAQTVAALGLLSHGGSFVVKAFTLLQPSSVCLVYFVAGVFEKVSVCKPPASKQGNSEVYLICRGFLGLAHRGEGDKTRSRERGEAGMCASRVAVRADGPGGDAEQGHAREKVAPGGGGMAGSEGAGDEVLVGEVVPAAGCSESPYHSVWLHLVSQIGSDGSSCVPRGPRAQGQESDAGDCGSGAHGALLRKKCGKEGAGATHGDGLGVAQETGFAGVALEGRSGGDGRVVTSRYGLVALSKIPEEWLHQFKMAEKMFCEVQQAVISSNVQLWCAACANSPGAEGAVAGGGSESGDSDNQSRGGWLACRGTAAHRKMRQEYAQHLCCLSRHGAEEGKGGAVLRDEDRLLHAHDRSRQEGGCKGKRGAGYGEAGGLRTDRAKSKCDGEQRRRLSREVQGAGGDAVCAGGDGSEALRLVMGLPLAFGCPR